MKYRHSFSGVYVSQFPSIQIIYQQTNKKMDPLVITYTSVLEILQSLDPTSSAGPDGIHPKLLVSCASSLACPLAVIFTKSLGTATFLSHWSGSLDIPLFKGGLRREALNYRPVSLTSVCCKVMERALTRHIMNYLEANNLLDSNQYAFRQ